MWRKLISQEDGERRQLSQWGAGSTSLSEANWIEQASSTCGANSFYPALRSQSRLHKGSRNEEGSRWAQWSHTPSQLSASISLLRGTTYVLPPAYKEDPNRTIPQSSSLYYAAFLEMVRCYNAWYEPGTATTTATFKRAALSMLGLESSSASSVLWQGCLKGKNTPEGDT